MKRKKFQFRIDATFDIETTNWTEFVIGDLYELKTGRHYTFAKEKEMFNFLIHYSGVVWAHNGGRFDFIWFLKNLFEHTNYKPQIIERGSSLLVVKVNRLELVDSMGLLPMSLSKAGSIVGSDKIDFDVSKIERWGNMVEEKQKEITEYLWRDTELLAQVLEFIKSYAKENDIVLRYTIGSTSWKTVSKHLGIKPAKWVPSEYDFVRSAYFGGRCEVFMTKADIGFRFDRNSSYPASLKNTLLPMGERIFVSDSKTASYSFDKYEGVYKVKVKVPEMYVPVLPYRKDKRLFFPLGVLEGIWTRNELIYAIENDYEILEIKQAYIWKASDNIFSEYIDYIWGLRKNAETEGLNKWLKWLANSLTGKFAEKPEKSIIKVGNEIKSCGGGIGEHDGPCPTHKCCIHRCVGACGSGTILSSELGITSHKVFRIPGNAYPQFAAYLTADARISLHKQLIVGTPIYCDTDSCYKIENEIKDLGEDLGQWGFEGKMTDWLAIAPKLYRYRDEKGKWHVKGKGLTGLTKDGMDRLLNGETWKMPERPATFRAGLRRQMPLFDKITMEKKLHKHDLVGDRKLDGTKTYPINIEQIERGEK